jgi:hypothetical protein
MLGKILPKKKLTNMNYRTKPDFVIWNDEEWIRMAVVMKKYIIGYSTINKLMNQGKVRVIDYSRIRYVSSKDLDKIEVVTINF